MSMYRLLTCCNLNASVRLSSKPLWIRSVCARCVRRMFYQIRDHSNLYFFSKRPILLSTVNPFVGSNYLLDSAVAWRKRRKTLSNLLWIAPDRCARKLHFGWRFAASLVLYKKFLQHVAVMGYPFCIIWPGTFSFPPRRCEKESPVGIVSQVANHSFYQRSSLFRFILAQTSGNGLTCEGRSLHKINFEINQNF